MTMPEITAALDEQGANKLLDLAIAAIGTQTKSGTGNLGPFVASYTIAGTLTNGDVDLIPPSTIRIVDLRLDWHLDLNFSFDLSTILPDFCLPRVCIDIPCVGEVCTPKICIDWPTIPIGVSFGDFLKTTADFQLVAALSAGRWKVHVEVLGVPNLQFGPASAALLVAIGLAATPVLLLVPFIGPFLAIAVNLILAAIAIAGVTGFLGPIITPFVSGLKIPVYDQPQLFEVLPAEGPFDPKVDVNIDAIGAAVAHNGTEDELVLTADISA
jgi:hypothetical protein